MDRVLGAGLCAERVGGLGWVSSGRLGGGCWMRRRGEGPPQKKTRLSTRLLEKVWFCSPRPPRFLTSLFSFPLQEEKGSIPPGGGVLACRRFRDSPNPSIGESSKEDEKARASSFEDLANKSIPQGTVIEAPRSCPEVYSEADN